MYRNENVITWELPESFVSEKTVDLITKEEKKIFNEFVFTCVSVIGAVAVLM